MSTGCPWRNRESRTNGSQIGHRLKTSPTVDIACDIDPAGLAPADVELFPGGILLSLLPFLVLWWLDGQFIYVNPAANSVIVRHGTSSGNIDWISLLRTITDFTAGSSQAD